MEKLQNKDVRTLNNELKTEHTKHTEGLLYNGELREAAKVVAKNTLNALKKQGQNILDSDCDGATKKKLETKQGALVNEIITYTNTIANTEYLFSHDKHLNQLAQRIDNAENEIASMIEDIGRKQELQATKETIGSKYFKELPKGGLKLTTATNAPRIDQVLGKLIQPGKVWKIDYSGCTNEKYKNMMIEAMGGLSSGFISKGIDSQGNITFTIKNLDGKPISQRAIIREGVTLYPSEAIVDEKLKQQQNKTNQLKNVDVGTKFKQSSALGKYPGLAKALGNKKKVAEFITLSEKQLHDTIVDAKKHGWELHSEPITSKWLTKGQILEAHLINETGEKDVALFTNSIDSAIYDILDDHEPDLIKYMTTRIKQKWNEYGHLDKVNTVAVGMQEKGKQTTILNDVQKKQVISGLQGLTTMIQNMIDAEGDTKLGTRDEKLRALSSYLRDITAAVATGKKMTQYDVDKFSGKIAQLYRLAFDLSDTYTSRDGIQTQNYDSKKDMKTILLGKPQEVANAMRTLGERSTYGSNTNTSFLADDIANNKELIGGTDKNGDGKITDDEKETKSTMKIEKTTYNDCFQRIETLLGSNNPGSKAKIDEMYAKNSVVGLFAWFKNNKLLPENAFITDGSLESRTTTIFNQLKATEKQITNVDAITANARKGRVEDKNKLEAKGTLTDEEMQQLQVLHVLELHPDKANEAIQGILTSMKYESVANLIRGQLTPWLVKEGGGVTGPNADTYNDIVGAGGWLDFSDANAVSTQGMIVMAVEEIGSIIIASLLIAASPVTLGTSGVAGVAMITAKFGKRGPKILSFVKSLGKNIAIAGLAQGMVAGERSIKDGGIDHQIDAFTLGFAQKLGMLSVLKAVTNSATSGTLARLFAKAPNGKMKVAGQISTQLLAEEIGMAGTDYASTLILSDKSFTLKELTDNLLLGIVFEAIPGVKKVIINPKNFNVDDKIFTIPEAKAEIDKKLAIPDVKKAVEAKLKQYEGVKKSANVTKEKINVEELHFSDEEIIKNYNYYKAQYNKVQKMEIIGDEAIKITQEFKKFKQLYKKIQNKPATVQNTSQKKSDEGVKNLPEGKKTDGLSPLSSILKKGNIITINGDKHVYLGINDGKAQFASQKDKSLVEISSLKELADARFNLEPGNKQTNAGRNEKLKKLLENEKTVSENNNTVINSNKIEQKAKSENVPSEKLLTDITLEGVTITPAVVTYFKDNPIPESVAIKLTPEDIKHIDDYLTNDMYKDGFEGATREQMVQGYIRDVVVKRADAPARMEVKGQEIKEIEKIIESTPKNTTEAKKQGSRLFNMLNNTKEKLSESIDKINQWLDRLNDSFKKLPIIKQLREYVQVRWGNKLATSDALEESFVGGLLIKKVKITKYGAGQINQYYPGLKPGDTILELHIDPSFKIDEAKKGLINFMQNQGKDAKLIYGMSHLTVLGKRFGFDIHMDKTLQQISGAKDFIFDPINDASHVFVKKYNLMIPEGVTIKEYFKKNPDQLNQFKVENNSINNKQSKEIDMRMKYDVKDIGLMIQSPKKLLERLTGVKQTADSVALKNDIQRIEHDFAKTPELKLYNKEVVLSPKVGEQFSVFMGRSEYVIEKNTAGAILFSKKGDDLLKVLEVGKEYTIGRNHNELTGKINDKFISRDHMSIKTDEKGNIVVKDLKTENQTVLRKVTGKSVNTNNKKQKKIYN